MARNKYPEETVKLILDTAAKLFTQKGFEKTSLQDIINETDLSKGAIYHHFASKEEIFIRICERVGKDNERVLEKVLSDNSLNGREKLGAIFRVSLLHGNQQIMLNIVPYLLDSPKFLAIQIRSLFDEVVPDYIQPILEEGIADGSIQAEHPKELAEALMVLTNVWLHPLLKPTTTEEMRDRCSVFKRMMEGIGLGQILDEEMEEAYISYSTILSGRS